MMEPTPDAEVGPGPAQGNIQGWPGRWHQQPDLPGHVHINTFPQAWFHMIYYDFNYYTIIVYTNNACFEGVP